MIKLISKLLGKEKVKSDSKPEQRTVESNEPSNENEKVERNLKGMELEKNGELDQAIKLYEMNVQEGFDGNHPYDRLAIIYRKQKLYNEEIRVLERAIEVFSNLKETSSRQDIDPKLKKFKDRLDKANELSKS
ncbi:tetratricopeptide repeat protein [Bacillus sp. FJAT-45037]|uniref:tetratricopeptide repeat protein n=1 Tax=Bacillus sp. FJAT-45037 TaxID=2011007 RepID=UPI0018E1F002|nr:tetratricopeptide repeat protein [Bacillus sp. FJAT-45037]